MEGDRIITVRKTTLAEQEQDDDVALLTPGQRMELIELITIDAYAMKGEDVAQQRLQRDAVRVERRGR